MARTPLFLLLAAFGLAMTGCSAVVQTRYQPTSFDEAVSISRANGIGNEVYELPAAPPALTEEDFRPRSCRPPGLLMKPMDMVGLSRDRDRPMRHSGEPTSLAAMTEEPPPPSPRPGLPYRIATWNPHSERGAKESIASPPYSPRLEPGRSIYRAEPQQISAYQDFERVWCAEGARLR